MSTEETAEMERAIAALALELPAEVWEDVRDRWRAARDSLGDRIEAVEAALPVTFYADLPLDERVARMADEWRRKTKVISELEGQ